MKIVFSNYDDIDNPYYGGGGAVAIHETAKRLARVHDITVLTGKYAGSKDRVIDKVSYKRIGFSSIHPKLAQLMYQLLLPLYIIRLRKDFDIWFENFTPPFSTACLQLFTHKPVIGVAHLLGGKDMSRKYHFPFHVIENLGLKTYKYFVVLNKNIYIKIKQQNPQAHIKIIPNGINSSFFNKKISHKKKTHILFLGRFEEQKGLDLLLDAYKKVENDIRYKLVLAGATDTKYTGDLRKKIRSLHLETKVAIKKRVKGKEKSELFSKAVLVVLPSRYETQPLVLFEAMACGLPVIVFDIDDLSWISKKYVIKVKPFDIREFSKAMLDVVADSSKYRSISDEAKKYAKKFNWNSVTNDYLKLIQSYLA